MRCKFKDKRPPPTKPVQHKLHITTLPLLLSLLHFLSLSQPKKIQSHSSKNMEIRTDSSIKFSLLTFLILLPFTVSLSTNPKRMMYEIACTMCSTCCNPEPAPPPPSIPSPPPPSPPPPQPTTPYCPPPPSPSGGGGGSSYSSPPPPSTYTYSSPPPPQGVIGGTYNPPPNHSNYPGPPPPNPIVPYFPYFYYNPPPPSSTSSASAVKLNNHINAVLIFVLFFSLFL